MIQFKGFEYKPIDYQGYLEFSVLELNKYDDGSLSAVGKHDYIDYHICNDTDRKHFLINDDYSDDYLKSQEVDKLG